MRIDINDPRPEDLDPHHLAPRREIIIDGVPNDAVVIKYSMNMGGWSELTVDGVVQEDYSLYVNGILTGRRASGMMLRMGVQ